MAWFSQTIAVPIVCFPFLIGCGSKNADDTKHPRYAVKGKILYNGDPMPGAMVTLHHMPLEKNTVRTVKPRGQVGPDGSFTLSSFSSGDGAIEGEFALTIHWSGETGEPGPDLLKGKFNDPTKAVAIVTIQQGDNTIPLIELSGPPLNPAPRKDEPDKK